MLMVTQLCGFGAAGRVPLTTITQVASATSAAQTITVPAGVIAGDLLVLLDLVAGPLDQVIPSGFTSISNINDASNFRQIVSYKIADGSEASTSLTGMNGALGELKALYVMRGNSPAISATVASVNGQATTGNPTAQTVTASGGTPPLVVFGCYGLSSGTIDPRTMSPAKDGEINPATNLYLAYKIYNTSPADVTVDMDDEGTNLLQSFYISLS